MTYLDTGCFVKLYYPEPDSAKVIALIRGKVVCLTRLHELEFLNAMQLKVFHGTANPSQVQAARALVSADLQSSILTTVPVDWDAAFGEAIRLAGTYTDSVGCRSLDILHCAAAKLLGVSEFVSTDGRQKKLATAMGLNLVSF